MVWTSGSHLIGMLPWYLGGFYARPTGKRTQGRSRTHWRECVTFLAWEKLGINPIGTGEDRWGEGGLWFSPGPVASTVSPISSR